MSKSMRLLQIEDSESDADMILRLLMQAGFEVFSQRVDDAEGLRRALDDPTWDLIIADYHLPGFDAPGCTSHSSGVRQGHSLHRSVGHDG